MIYMRSFYVCAWKFLMQSRHNNSNDISDTIIGKIVNLYYLLLLKAVQLSLITRMHSSRMRTVRSISHIPGGCTWSRGGVPGPGGCTWSRGGVPGPGGYTWSQGVYLVPGGVPGQVLPPPVDRHTLVKT